MANKYNPINVIQKWMDTMAGQTFMNYAYSWGAAVVILGTLFKLTHIPGANLMLFIGMGTEVFVFIVAGFERVTEKVPEQLTTGVAGGTTIIGGGAPVVSGTPAEGAAPVEGAVAGGQPVIIQGGAPTDGPIIIGGGGPAVVGATGTADPAALLATDSTSVEDAIKNYAEQLTDLTEVLGRVKDQAARMSTDSEEMENLNRTLTGIATVYELQLRNISKQVATIEQIDEQTRRMASQIEELNNVYARMIKALTVNMTPAASVAPAAE